LVSRRGHGDSWKLFVAAPEQGEQAAHILVYKAE
jgi:hypothetical protein